MKAMILAAGVGVRMRPLTDKTPKPLLTVRGRSLLDYHLHHLAVSGFKDIVINISHLGEQIEKALGNGESFGVNIQYSKEASPLETGGGIFQALPLLGEKPFIVVSGDIFTHYDFKKLPQDPDGLAHLVLNHVPQFNKKGDFALNNGYVNTEGTQKLNYANIAVLRPELFADSAPGIYPLAPLLKNAMASQKVTGEYFDGLWYNIGTPDILEEVNSLAL